MSDLEHVRTMWAQDTASADLGITCLDVGVSSANTIPSKAHEPTQHPEQTPRRARNIPSKTDGSAHHPEQTRGVETARPLGWARTSMTVTPQMVNGHGICHGGYVFTLADSTFALACNAPGQLTVASGAEITFVASAHEGDVLLAHARERTAYGRSGITDVTVVREGDGAVVAEFRGRSRTLSQRSER